MARSYEIRELVKLPRLDASAADALVTELLAHARGKALPGAVERAREQLADAQKALASAITARLQALPIQDAARARVADQAVDTAFSATFDWLTGLSKLPDTFTQAALARRVLGVLFRDGLRFTQLSFKLEWAEADARLRAVAADPSLEDAFTTLGCPAFLENLRSAHEAYGEALGITSPKEAEQAAVLVKEPLAAVRDALRTYALRILAHDGDAAWAEVADALLAPLAAWESRSRVGKPAAPPALAPQTAPAPCES